MTALKASWEARTTEEAYERFAQTITDGVVELMLSATVTTEVRTTVTGASASGGPVTGTGTGAGTGKLS